MADSILNKQTGLSGEEVITRAVQFFSTESWRTTSQSPRAATFEGRPPIPWFMLLLTFIGYLCCIVPGIIMYIQGLKAPIIGPDGTVYVTSYESASLYAFYGPAPVACGQWPQFRNNSRNSAAWAVASMNSPMMTTNGFKITILGPTNMPVCPCASSDLVNWTNIGQTVLTGGATNFVDTGATNYQHRFYRAFPQ